MDRRISRGGFRPRSLRLVRMRLAGSAHSTGLGLPGAGCQHSLRAARGGEYGELLRQFRRATPWAFRPLPRGGTHQHFGIFTTLPAMKLVNWHELVLPKSGPASQDRP